MISGGEKSIGGSSLVGRKEEVGKEGKLDAGKEFISLMCKADLAVATYTSR